MIGYILTEPDLRVERVPEELVHRTYLLWPANRNVLPEKLPGAATPMINPKELYKRELLGGDGIAVFVWSQRDPNALPDNVIRTIRDKAQADSASGDLENTA